MSEFDNQVNNLNPNNQFNINDFQIISMLSNGFHGSFNKVKCLKNNLLYTLKMIPQNIFKKNDNQINNEKEIDYQREISILNDMTKKNNPNIIKIYGNFQDQNYRYIILEYVEGKTLTQLRKEYEQKNEYIPQKLIIHILKQILNILTFLHDNCHIIHRDIIPDNIIIDNNGNIKLMSFDLSAYLENQNPVLVSRKSIKGSRKYSAPEILYKSGQINYDYKIDIFSLGFTMFNIMNPNEIEGQDKNLPYFTDNENQRTINMKNNNEFYDEWLKKLVESFYSPDPNLRPTAKSALDFLLINEKNPSKHYPYKAK